jgi:hypothetical protein
MSLRSPPSSGSYVSRFVFAVRRIRQDVSPWRCCFRSYDRGMKRHIARFNQSQDSEDKAPWKCLISEMLDLPRFRGHCSPYTLPGPQESNSLLSREECGRRHGRPGMTARSLLTRGPTVPEPPEAHPKTVPVGKRTAVEVVRPGKADVFSGRQTHRGNSQEPRSWTAGRRETEPLKPVDKPIRGMGSESSGRNGSEREVASKVPSPRGRARNLRAKAAWHAAG